MPKFFLPYLELLWKRLPAPLEEIKVAGFDGVECHLVGGLCSLDRVTQVIQEASKLGLDVRFHQGWSWDTAKRDIFRLIMAATGTLAPRGVSLEKQTEPAGERTVVVYGNHIGADDQSNYVYQTTAEQSGNGYALSFGEFFQGVIHRRLPLVFDNQHILEWSADANGVGDLCPDGQVLCERVENLWREMHHLVAEIHLCDFDPSRGNSKGRNLFLGRGIFPLTQFCTLVQSTGWEGIVVPEVAPQYLREKSQLRELRKKMDQLFVPVLSKV